MAWAPWPALSRVVDVRPVLSWKTRVVFLKTVSRGHPAQLWVDAAGAPTEPDRHASGRVRGKW